MAGIPRVLLVLVALTALTTACGEEPLRYGAGIRAPEAPLQESVAERRIVKGDFVLTVRATFTVTAKLLSKTRYRWDDLADAAPWDYAIAWGIMSDEAVLEGTRITQGDRLMYWHLYEMPLPLALVERSSANLHLVPATPAIAEALAGVPEGAIVTLGGELADLTLPDGSTIPTSLTRSDRGVGACEILHVTTVRWERPEA